MERKKSFLRAGLLVIALALTVIMVLLGKEYVKYNKLSPVERVRLSYDEVSDESMQVDTGFQFGAYFLSDIDGDGELDRVDGTCNRVGEEDTLYIFGKLEEGVTITEPVIRIEAENFYFSTNIIENEIVKGVYISENTTEIVLNDLTGPIEFEINGKVRSGDYSDEATKRSAFKLGDYDFSKSNNITFYGMYDYTENYEVYEMAAGSTFRVDWYGIAEAQIVDREQAYSNSEIKNEEKNTVELKFNIEVEEKNKEVFLNKHYVEGIIPKLNGYEPNSVEIVGEEIETTYNQETRAFTITRKEYLNDDEGIYGYVSSQNRYEIYVEYPLEAYNYLEEPILNLEVPIQTYFECYNNSNSEFEDLLKSNVVEDVLHIIYGEVSNNLENIEVKTTIGENLIKPYDNFVIAKDKYENIKDVEYSKSWQINTSKDEETNKVIITETVDSFIDSAGNEYTAEDTTVYNGIYFINAYQTVKSSIKVYNDETNELIHEFTKDDWSKYSEDNLYEFENTVNKVRVEIDGLNKANKLYINFSKRILGSSLEKVFDENTYNNLNRVKSYINVNIEKINNEIDVLESESLARFDEVKSIAIISDMSKNDFSIQNRLNNVKITISTIEQRYNTAKWIDGEFLLEFPEEIYDVEINEVLVNNNQIIVNEYEKFNKNGKVFIKLNTENIVPSVYDIVVDCNIVVNSDVEIGDKSLKLYYENQLEKNYLDNYSIIDSIDMNNNLVDDEIVGYYEKTMSIVKPYTLNTYEKATNYNANNDVEVSPRTAKLDNTSNRKATVTINISNENTNSLKDIIIVGKIPFKNNKSHISAKDLGSTFSTTLNSEILVPEELKAYTKVYYSEQENVTNSLDNATNDWKENYDDLSKVKTFLIEISNFEMLSGNSYEFSYGINIPDNIEYNDTSYATHAVFYNIVSTDGTTVKKQIESSKIGFALEKTFSMNISSLKLGKDTKVSDIIYNISEENTRNGYNVVCNSNGYGSINELILNKTYVMTISKDTQNYSRQGFEIKFKAYEENEELKIEIISGEDKVRDVSINNNVIEIKTEIEAKNKLTINVADDYGNMAGAEFSVVGENFNETVTTSSNGQAYVEGIEIDKTYTIKQTNAIGHEFDSNEYTLLVSRNENGLYITTNGTFEYYVQETAENQNNITIKVTNNKINSYSLRVNKKDVTTGNAITENIYNLSGKWLPENGEKYEVNDQGYFTVSNLYEGVEYQLTEYWIDEDYSINNEAIIFSVTKNALGNLEVTSTNSKYTADDETVTYNLENSKKIKIYTKDLQEGKLIPEAKYSIKAITLETDSIIETDAFDIYGKNIGKLENINGESLRTLTSDENGEIKESFATGLYKLVNIELPKGYVLEEEEKTLYFGVGMSITDIRRITSEDEESFDENSGLKYKKALSNSDGTKILVAEFDSNIRIPKEKTSGGTNLEVNIAPNYTRNIAILKVDGENKVEWLRSAISVSGNLEVKDICKVSDGYILIGNVEGNEIVSGNYSVKNNADINGFVMKVLEDGSVNSLYIMKSKEKSEFYEILNVNEEIYVVGNFMGDATIESAMATNGSISLSSETQSGLIAKLNSNAKFKSVVLIDSDGIDNISDIEQKNNNVLITLETDNDITIPASIMESGVNTKIEKTSENIKLEMNSNLKVVNTNNTDNLSNISILQVDDGYILVGEFDESYSINKNDTVAGNEIKLTSKGDTDIAYIKYNSSNKVEWAKSLGGEYDELVCAVKEDYDGNYIILANSNSGELSIEKENVENGYQLDVTTTGYKTGIIMKITTDGKARWITTIGDYANIFIYDMTIEGDGEYKLVGTYNSEEIKYVLKEDIVLNAIDEIEEANVNINKEEYTITAVETTGGKVVDQNGNIFKTEKLYYGENSEYDLKIVPDNGYELISLKINGKEVDFSVENDGSTIIGNYTNVEESFYIEPTFATNIGNVIVYHYKEGTTENVCESELFRGTIGESYSVYPKTDLNRYIVNQDMLPNDTMGTYGEEDKIIIFYYTQREKIVTINHYLEGTDVILAPTEKVIFNIGEEYITEPLEIEEKYEVAFVAGETSGIVEDNIEINYYYRIKIFDITTEILTGKGSVDGSEYTVYETVKYGESSNKEIKITAEEGYSIQRVVVNYDNGTNIVSEDITANLDLTQKTITLDKFENITSDINVQVDFDRKAISLTVHYYQKDTTIQVSQDVIITGFIGEEYETYPSEDVNLDKYELVETPVNSIGTLEIDGEELYYYYKLREYTVSGSVIGEGGTVKIGDTSSEVVTYGSSTKNDVEVQADKGYKIESITINGKAYDVSAQNSGKIVIGKITDVVENVVIEATFEKIPAEVIVNFYENDSTTEVASSQVIPGYMFEEYTIEIPTDINTEKYSIDKIEIQPENATFNKDTLKGTFDVEDIEINVYFKIAEYQISATTNEGGVITDVNEIVKYGESSTKDIIITPDYGYKVSKITINGLDVPFEANDKVVILEKFTNIKENKIINVEFEKLDATVTVKYIDRSENEIKAPLVITGKVGDSYQTQREEIYGYRAYGEEPTNTAGTMTEQEIVIEYIYEKIPAEVLVEYIDKDGNMFETITLKGYVGEEYKTERKTYDGYRAYGEEPANAIGKYTEEKITVRYVYEKIPAQVFINYYEYGTGDKIAEEIILEGNVGDDYTTIEAESINKDKYLLKEIEAASDGTYIYDKETRNGKFIKEITYVNYYYEIATFTVSAIAGAEGSINDITETVKYGETTTKDLLITPRNGYRVLSVKVNGQEVEFFENDNRTATINKIENVTENIEITVEFTRIEAEVKVNYCEANTTTKISESTVVKGYVNDSYKTEEPVDLNKAKYIFSHISVQSSKDVNYNTETKEGVFTDSVVEITYYYEVARFGISGIASDGGSISDIQESVRYGESSTKDIIIVPNYGYQIVEIFVNGEEIEFVENEEGTVELEKFTNVIENKVIVAQFARRAAYTYINYYEENSTKKIADTFMQTGFVDDEYTAKEPENLDTNKFILAGITVENEDAIFDKVTLKGKFVKNDTIINYYYKVTKHEITISHNEGGTVNTTGETVIYGENSVKDIIIKPYIGYEISKITINDEEIEFEADESGKVILDKFENVTEDKNIVVEFERIKCFVYINYLDNYGNIIEEQEEKFGYMGETFNVQRKQIPKYVGLEGDKDSYSGIYTLEPITINFIYEKAKGIVKIEYVDTEGNYIISSDFIKDEVDKPYETERKEIYGYRAYGEDPENKSGNIVEGTTYVRYVYEKIPAQVIVNYLKDNGDIIHEAEVVNGYVGEKYEITRKSFEYYVGCENDPNEYVGEFTEEPIEITFIYEKIKCKLLVRYVDKDGVDIIPSELKTGEIAESYEVTRKDIPNYRPAEPEPTNKIGVYTENQITVTFVYEKIPAQITVRYIDTEGNEIIESDVVTGYLGENYKIERKNIDGYRTYGEDPIEYTGEYTSESSEVTFVYERIPAEVIVRYVDTEGNELIPAETVYGYVGEIYEITRKNIEFYKKSGEDPNNSVGKFTEETITVTFVYEKIKGQVVAKYVDTEGNVLADEVIIEGEAGDEYKTERKEIYGYKPYGEEPANKEGIINKEAIEVVYVYEKIPAQVIIKYVDTEGNELIPAEIIDGYVSEKYETQSKEIEGYETTAEPENKSGEFTEEQIEVVYTYKIKQLKIVTRIIGAEDSGTVTGNGEEYYEVVEYGKDATKDIIIAIKYGYRLVKITVNDVEVEYIKNEDGTFTIPAFKEVKEDKIIKVETERIKADVVVKYVDTEGNQIAEPLTIEGLLGNEYKTERKEIEYYRAYGEEPENAEGVFIEGVIEVVYVYERIPSGVVTVKYLEKDTDKELAEEETISGYVGEIYTIEEKNVDYYKIVSEEEKDGRLTEEDKTIIIYYEKLKFDIEMISYIDKVIVNSAERTIARDNVAKVEIDRENIQNNEVLVVYKVIVKNSGEMAGYAKTVIDYIPSGMLYLEGDNIKTKWQVKGDMLVNTDLESILLNPGESAELELVLRWDNGENSFGERINQVIVSDYINEAGWKDVNTSNNTAKVSFIITVKTGHINQIELMSRIFDIVIFLVLNAGIVMRIIQIKKAKNY